MKKSMDEIEKEIEKKSRRIPPYQRSSSAFLGTTTQPGFPFGYGQLGVYTGTIKKVGHHYFLKLGCREYIAHDLKEMMSFIEKELKEFIKLKDMLE